MNAASRIFAAITRAGLFAAFATALSFPAFAQPVNQSQPINPGGTQPRPRPSGTEVVDELVKPPQVRDLKDNVTEAPAVTTRQENGTTITEYRMRGKLYQQKVQPASGPAYYLVDDKGEGKFARVDGPDVKLAVPMWVVKEF